MEGRFNLGVANGIYAGHNPWGYQLNINHPFIQEYYVRYKKWKGILGAPSDQQRLEFEDYIFNHFKQVKRRV